MNHRFATSSLVLLLLCAFGAGCTKNEASSAKAGRPGGNAAAKAFAGKGPAAAQPGVPVEVAQAYVGPVSAFLRFNSTLEVETSVTVYPEAAGLVEKILVEEGDRVKANDPLLELEHDEQEVDLRESEANLVQLNKSFDRTKDLFERGLINRQDFDTSSFELEQAKLRLERARIMVEQATVRAPVDGVITQRFVQPGARVTASTQLFGLMSLDDMIARVFVPGRYLATVATGQEAYLTSEFLPGKRFEGWVKRISPIVDPANGTFKVTVGVHPGADQPPPGLFVDVRIVTDRREAAILIPKKAIVYEGGERFVFLVKDGKASRIRLDAGYEEGEVVEALKAVQPGDNVVVLGQSALKDAAPVRIVNKEETAAAVASPNRSNPASTASADS